MNNNNKGVTISQARIKSTYALNENRAGLLGYADVNFFENSVKDDKVYVKDINVLYSDGAVAIFNRAKIDTFMLREVANILNDIASKAEIAADDLRKVNHVK